MQTLPVTQQHVEYDSSVALLRRCTTCRVRLILMLLFICCLAASLHNMHDACGGSHPAVDLPTLDAEVLNEVRDLNHYPQRRKVTQSVA